MLVRLCNEMEAKRKRKLKCENFMNFIKIENFSQKKGLLWRAILSSLWAYLVNFIV